MRKSKKKVSSRRKSKKKKSSRRKSKRKHSMNKSSKRSQSLSRIVRDVDNLYSTGQAPKLKKIFQHLLNKIEKNNILIVNFLKYTKVLQECNDNLRSCINNQATLEKKIEELEEVIRKKDTPPGMYG